MQIYTLCSVPLIYFFSRLVCFALKKFFQNNSSVNLNLFKITVKKCIESEIVEWNELRWFHVIVWLYVSIEWLKLLPRYMRPYMSLCALVINQTKCITVDSKVLCTWFWECMNAHSENKRASKRKTGREIDTIFKIANIYSIS